jgi:cell volume regulation protein A
MVDVSVIALGLLVGVVFLGVVSEILFHKFRIPEQIILLLAGVLIQYVGIISSTTHSYLTQVAPILGTIVLGLILLDAGLSMRAYDMLVRSSRVLLLALLEPITTAACFAFIMHFAFGWNLIYGAIFGALLGSTTGEVIVTLLRSVKTDETTENILVLDCVYNSVTTIVIFQIVYGFATSPHSVSLPLAIGAIASQFVFAIVIGVAGGFAWALFALKRIHDHQYLITIAAAFAVYLGSQVLGGNGLLSILLFGIIIGNYVESYRKLLGSLLHGVILGKLGSEIKEALQISQDSSVKSLRNAQKEITFVSKVFFFVYLGILFKFDSRFVLFGVVFSFLLFGLKFLDLKALRLKNVNSKFLSLVGPRGITPIILSEEFYAWAKANQSPSFVNSIGEPILSMTFVIIFTTIIASVIFAVLLTGGGAQNEERTRISIERSDFWD